MRPIAESTPDRTVFHRGLARVLLWAMVVLMGIQLGGGLYEHTAAVPQWANAPGELLPDALASSVQVRAAAAFWPFVSPILVVVAMMNAFAAGSTRGRVRYWWLFAALLELLVQVATWTYFVPELAALANGDSPPAELEQRALAWVRFGTARIALEAFAWSLALAALVRWRGGADGSDDHDDNVVTRSVG